MAKLRLTKNELRRQKDALKRYNRYLPTLILKKQQLQAELVKIHHAMEEIKKERAYLKAKVYEWSDVFAEKIGIEKLFKLEKIETLPGNIAGVDIPVFDRVVFEEKSYDFMETPLWLDAGIEMLKKVLTLNAKMEIFKKQDEVIRAELRVTTQRVNLFEKIMIPRAVQNIKKIRIYLSDIETAAVVTGKIAKGLLTREVLIS